MASSPGELTVRSGRVKHARRLATRAFRASTGEFLAEGPQAVREALATPGSAQEVFATVAASDHHAELRAAAEAAEVPWHVVTDDVVQSIADTVQPQGLVARCTTPVSTLDEVLATDPTFVVTMSEDPSRFTSRAPTATSFTRWRRIRQRRRVAGMSRSRDRPSR